MGVNVTEQVPLARVHVGELKVPVAPELVQLTVPVGTLVVPGELSLTVAVHVAATPIDPDDGHVTTVFVALLFTVIVLLGVAAPAA